MPIKKFLINWLSKRADTTLGNYLVIYPINEEKIIKLYDLPELWPLGQKPEQETPTEYPVD